MEHNTLFKLIYTLILGVAITLFVGVGVQAFYEPPKSPEYPTSQAMYKAEAPTPEEQKAQKQYEVAMSDYSKSRQTYERNVSMVLVGLAVVVIAIGLTFSRQIGFLSDGILLGGLFTLLHSLIRGFAAEDSKFLFVVATVAVATILFLGYRRFSHVGSPTKKKSKK
ncbi:MAG: hypothetical protein ABIQ64_03650 [Candidatus Saccharimonadales bacterium]